MGNPSGKNHYLYNASLQKNAHKLRYTMTKAEACLWKYVLRAAQMKGYTFRRQRPVLNYVADFMCKELLLIIEVDGITHLWEETQVKDKIRQDALEKAGFTVIRFNDEEVLKDIKGVSNRIAEKIEEIESRKMVKEDK